MIGKMKNLLLLAIIAALLALTNCSKDDENDRYELLTRVTWSTDSLLMNGQDASGPGEIMEKFKGTAKFNKDGTGTFGMYTGTWRFPDKTRTQLVLVTDSLPLPLTTSIVELTDISLKVTFMLPGFTDRYRMTFKAK
jgi:hypothetical protein